MRRLRTAKAVASRIDLTYFKRTHVLRRTRFILTIVGTVGALGWWGVYWTRGDRMLYNPGALTGVHGSYENNCALCHDANGKGGFFKSVSDNACTQCHDAAIHSTKQIALIAAVAPVMSKNHMPAAEGAAAENKPAEEGKAPETAKSDAGAGHFRSANCMQCHIEHRGHEALLGTSDVHCTQCHADLPKHIKGEPVIDPHVTAFTADAHPWFGRELAKSAFPAASSKAPPELTDPTDLKFNHALHMDKEGINHNCEICHTPEPVNPLAKPLTAETSGTPPWLERGSTMGKTSLGVSSQQAYMRPVSYSQHCAGCHDLKIDLPKGGALPHERMDLVRAVVMAQTPEQLQTWLAPKPKEMPAATPGGAPGPPRKPGAPPPPRRPGSSMASPPNLVRPVLLAAPPPPGRKGVAPPPPTGTGSGTAAAAPVQKSANDVALETVEKAIKRITSGQDDARKAEVKLAFEALKKQLTVPPTTQPAAAYATWAPDQLILRFVGNYLVDQQCTKCHGAQKDAGPAVASMTPALFTTTPTGITPLPRRWFIHSQFDHRPHRNVTCVQCHSKVETSKETSDVLVPNHTWTTTDGATASCMSCHHASTRSERGARADCQTCHVYHDRNLEGPPQKVTNIDEIVRWARPQKSSKPAATQPAGMSPTASAR